MITAPLPLEQARAADASAVGADAVSADARPHAGRDHPAADWIRVAASRNVLIVDDNDRHLDILSTILSSVGHNVETCGSGAEALRRLEGRHFDIVVLDLVMPEISGVVVAEQMRLSPVNCDTPIIICTANMTIARRQLQDIEGIVAIIGKPIDTASLVLAVARAPVRQRTSRASTHAKM
ncbi:MAG: response regulator [Hyphomonadaceae bacterium]